MLDVRVTKKQGDFMVQASFTSTSAGVTTLFGRSGAGKTSIINMTAGLVRPDSGRISLAGRCLFDSVEGIDVSPEKRRIGYVFQDGRLFPHLSVRSNLAYGMKLVPGGERYVQFDQVVDLLGIEHLLSRRPAKLSGGEKQRVAIGRALLTSPSLLLMDEPLASLDAARKAEVLPFIARLSRELSIPILYVSHSLDEILNLADTMVLLDSGRAVAAGTIEELMTRPALQLLTGRIDLGTVITTTVEIPDDASGLSHLRFSGGLLKAPRFEVVKGSRIRVRIDPRDVALSLHHPSEISIQNIFPGTIKTISDSSGGMVDVDLDIGCPLLARITPRARKELNLSVGRQVFALVKSVAILGIRSNRCTEIHLCGLPACSDT